MSSTFLTISNVVGSGALPRTEAQAWAVDVSGAFISADAAGKHGWRIGDTLTWHHMPGEELPDLTFKVVPGNPSCNI